MQQPILYCSDYIICTVNVPERGIAISPILFCLYIWLSCIARLRAAGVECCVSCWFIGALVPMTWFCSHLALSCFGYCHCMIYLLQSTICCSMKKVEMSNFYTNEL